MEDIEKSPNDVSGALGVVRGQDWELEAVKVKIIMTVPYLGFTLTILGRHWGDEFTRGRRHDN